eukprot:9879818-Alexandrium_andersonii.AAC.1
MGPELLAEATQFWPMDCARSLATLSSLGRPRLPRGRAGRPRRAGSVWPSWRPPDLLSPFRLLSPQLPLAPSPAPSTWQQTASGRPTGALGLRRAPALQIWARGN